VPAGRLQSNIVLELIAEEHSLALVLRES
jgi:hypothetical protein